MQTVWLKPDVLPVRAIADWLVREVREDQGAKSLAHLLVVVPTAESGRRLRLELSRRFKSGVIPPAFRLPADWLRGDESEPIADRGDELLAFWEARGGTDENFDSAAELADIRRILGANALSFADVAAFLTSEKGRALAPETEAERWRSLKDLEAHYLESLAKRGLKDRISVAQMALAHPVLAPEVEQVVVAAVLDPLPAFERALESSPCPVVRLEPDFQSGLKVPRRAQILQCATAADEAERIAGIFTSVRPDEALPALCLADPELFPELRSALQARGQTVHNPALTKLSTSSLGQLVRQISALKRTSSYTVFSAFVRGGDVRRWLLRQLVIRKDTTPDAAWAKAMTDLDNLQAKLLPEKIEDIAPKAEHTLRAIFEIVTTTLRKHDLRGVLRDIFRDHLLDEADPAAREFAAAAETVNALIDEGAGRELNERLREELFARRLEEATYSLEADEGDAIVTDGWLELPYLDTEELIVAGFNEGVVPESVVGHPFLPDALRQALGLPDNRQRAERDARILSLALACRPEGAVKIGFHTLDASGDQLKPSRLLFAGVDDVELVARVKDFYAESVGTSEGLPADLPESWKLKLPVPPDRTTLEFTSPTGIDGYLKCPFTYYLRKLFGEHENDRAEELDPSEFGNLAHEALERWGTGPNCNSDDAAVIAEELSAHVDELLSERFGTRIPAIVALQAESIKSRLRHFAEIQSVRRREGWEVIATERKLKVVYGKTTVKGKCDRVDYNPKTGQWCVIDYKTFDSAENAVAYDVRKKTWKSLQLPLYVAMLDADNDEFAAARRAQTISVYCVLGKTREQVIFTAPLSGEFVSEAEVEVRRLIDRMERGIFWPPSPVMAWQWDFKGWIFNTPEESVKADWIQDQEWRLKEVDGER